MKFKKLRFFLRRKTALQDSNDVLNSKSPSCVESQGVPGCLSRHQLVHAHSMCSPLRSTVHVTRILPTLHVEEVGSVLPSDTYEEGRSEGLGDNCYSLVSSGCRSGGLDVVNSTIDCSSPQSSCSTPRRSSKVGTAEPLSPSPRAGGVSRLQAVEVQHVRDDCASSPCATPTGEPRRGFHHVPPSARRDSIVVVVILVAVACLSVNRVLAVVATATIGLLVVFKGDESGRIQTCGRVLVDEPQDVFVHETVERQLSMSNSGGMRSTPRRSKSSMADILQSSHQNDPKTLAVLMGMIQRSPRSK